MSQEIAIQDVSEGDVREVAPDMGALASVQNSEINQQIATARRYPRSLTSFRKSMMDMVSLGKDVATACIYSLPARRGSTKAIEGPSVRFAEIAATAWGNCRYGARIVDIGQEYITAQGMFLDLEKNTAVTFEVLRRITTSEGHRYSADMIGTTGNAACSIALRNAVLKGVPQAFWGDAYRKARNVVAGDAKTLSESRIVMLKAFDEIGVTKEQVFALLGIKGAEDITTEHLVHMAGLLTSITDGEITADEAFAPERMQGDEAVPPRPTKSEFEREDKQDGRKKRAKTTKPADVQVGGVAATGEAGSFGTKAEPDAIEKVQNEAREETPLQRGTRIITGLTKAADVADLQSTITQELTDAGAPAGEITVWESICKRKIADLQGRHNDGIGIA